MSARATGWALDQDLPPVTKLVLVAIADECRRNGTVAFPGRGSLTKAVGIKARSISEHVARLEELNLVRRESRYRTNGSQTSNYYHLALDGPFDPDEWPVASSCKGAVEDEDEAPVAPRRKGQGAPRDKGPVAETAASPEPGVKSRTTPPKPPQGGQSKSKGRRRRGSHRVTEVRA